MKCYVYNVEQLHHGRFHIDSNCVSCGYLCVDGSHNVFWYCQAFPYNMLYIKTEKGYGGIEYRIR